MPKLTTENEILKTRYPQALEGNVRDARYFFFETEPDYKKELAIVFGGFEKCAPDFEIRRHSYPYFVIEYITKGKCRLKIGDREFELTKNTLAGFSPQTAHHYKCDPADPMEHYFVAFIGTEAAELLEKSTIAQKVAINLGKSPESSYLIETIFKKATEPTPYSHQLCCAYLKALLLEQAVGFTAAGKSSSLSMATYHNCKKYIDENFSQFNISPGRVADKCSVSVRYMSRLFKQIAAITPQDYIMRLKLNRAASLLLTTNMTVNQTAKEVGFADPYHFSRNFKKFHKISPLKFRANHL